MAIISQVPSLRHGQYFKSASPCESKPSSCFPHHPVVYASNFIGYSALVVRSTPNMHMHRELHVRNMFCIPIDCSLLPYFTLAADTFLWFNEEDIGCQSRSQAGSFACHSCCFKLTQCMLADGCSLAMKASVALHQATSTAVCLRLVVQPPLTSTLSWPRANATLLKLQPVLLALLVLLQVRSWHGRH